MIFRDPRKADLRECLERARARTLFLLDWVPDKLLDVRVHSFYSPIGWHFGHIGMTEEFWVLRQALGRPNLNDHFAFLFANIPENPKENRVHLPPRAQIVRYLEETRKRTLQALEEANLDADDFLIADGYAWNFAYQHECQHQETIVELMQLHQQAVGHPESGETFPWRMEHRSEMVTLPGGEFVMGSNHRFAYDNEREPHVRAVAPFEMDKTPVTAFEWTRFMEDGGYERPELWMEEGWAWREREGAVRPEYWLPTGRDRGYFAYGALGVRPIHPEEPVSCISWFEADAYARWVGKRLPTEVEWEYAATFDPTTGRSRKYPWGNEPPTPERACFGLHQFFPAPVGAESAGASAFGLLDMAGGVWEWTSTPFLPYPGFRAYPYDGYSKDHMDGEHYVCRGGSWATAGTILRSSFRNWYIPTYRQGLLGLRCAR